MPHRALDQHYPLLVCRSRKDLGLPRPALVTREDCAHPTRSLTPDVWFCMDASVLCCGQSHRDTVAHTRHCITTQSCTSMVQHQSLDAVRVLHESRDATAKVSFTGSRLTPLLFAAFSKGSNPTCLHLREVFRVFFLGPGEPRLLLLVCASRASKALAATNVASNALAFFRRGMGFREARGAERCQHRAHQETFKNTAGPVLTEARAQKPRAELPERVHAGTRNRTSSGNKKQAVSYPRWPRRRPCRGLHLCPTLACSGKAHRAGRAAHVAEVAERGLDGERCLQAGCGELAGT
jgi:hypothetical protein